MVNLDKDALHKELSCAIDELFESYAVKTETIYNDDLYEYGQILTYNYMNYSKILKRLVTVMHKEKCIKDACALIKELAGNRSITQTLLKSVNKRLSENGHEKLCNTNLIDSPKIKLKQYDLKSQMKSEDMKLKIQTSVVIGGHETQPMQLAR